MSPLLGGDKPVFLLHRSYRGGDNFARLANEVSDTSGGSVELGVVANLPNHGADAARAILRQARDYELRIADPMLHLHESSANPSQAQKRRAPYLTGTPPTRPERSVIDAVLEAQRRAGATVLLTPTGHVPEANGERSLESAMRWVRATRDAAPTEPLVVALTLSRTWLVDPGLREVLLNEIVDSNERNWYVRVRWAPLSPGHGQLADLDLLHSYRELAATAKSEGKVLLLPQTGLAGWLLTAIGAAGFSVGIGRPEQAYTEPVRIAMRGPRRPPVPRYFEPSLLHTIQVGTQAQLAGGSYTACACSYCARMRAGGDAIDAARWGSETAAAHLVASLARLQAQLAQPDRRAAARGLVIAAQGVRDGATPRLAGDDRPGHLDGWSGLLA